MYEARLNFEVRSRRRKAPAGATSPPVLQDEAGCGLGRRNLHAPNADQAELLLSAAQAR